MKKAKQIGSDVEALEAIPAASDAAGEFQHKGHFLRLMLYGPRYWSATPPRPLRASQRAPGIFAPLPQSTSTPGCRIKLPLPSGVPRVSLDSPATDVMTDLRRVGAITVDETASVDEANAAMIAGGVRALFVVDEARQVLGIVTATDVLGERPVMIAQERGLRHSDILVRDIMAPGDRLEIIDLRDVQHARVGDVVATLKRAGRQHAIAVETSSAPDQTDTWVHGIFSLTQIARQLGVWPHPTHDLARTFAEIEAIIGP
jgi:hypothetical protein